jgi:hypothetical protein
MTQFVYDIQKADLQSAPVKRVVIIKANGDTEAFTSEPTFEQIQKACGGHVEHVRVLDRIENGRFIYTSMYVNDSGLIDGLDRNKMATQIYQRNVRAAFPNSATPFADSEADMKRTAEELGLDIIDARPHYTDYNPNDPHIAGDVVLFEGYTCEEADYAIETASANGRAA